MIGCERCGRLDSTLRSTTFVYTISLLLMTMRRGSGGVYCNSCRRKEGLKYTLVSALMGWWGFPWGPIYTLQSIGRNSSGGLQDPTLNAQLLQAVAGALDERGDRTGAIAALEESLRLNDDGDARRALWALQGQVAPAAVPPSLAAPVQSEKSELRVNSFAPGALVRSCDGKTRLHPQAVDSNEPVGMLSSETAVVLRADAGWVELQIPGGVSGWASQAAVESA